MSPEPGRVLALDLGRVRIGMALSDPLGLTAQPLEVWKRVGPRKDLQRIAAVAVEHGATAVVIGLPLRLSGEEGQAAEEAREFVTGLERRLPGVEIHLWDERLTTAEAERSMIAGNVRRDKRKKVIDALAAVLILQNYLDSQVR